MAAAQLDSGDETWLREDAGVAVKRKTTVMTMMMPVGARTPPQTPLTQQQAEEEQQEQEMKMFEVDAGNRTPPTAAKRAVEVVEDELAMVEQHVFTPPPRPMKDMSKSRHRMDTAEASLVIEEPRSADVSKRLDTTFAESVPRSRGSHMHTSGTTTAELRLLETFKADVAEKVALLGQVMDLEGAQTHDLLRKLTEQNAALKAENESLKLDLRAALDNAARSQAIQETLETMNSEANTDRLLLRQQIVQLRAQMVELSASHEATLDLLRQVSESVSSMSRRNLETSTMQMQASQRSTAALQHRVKELEAQVAMKDRTILSMRDSLRLAAAATEALDQATAASEAHDRELQQVLHSLKSSGHSKSPGALKLHDLQPVQRSLLASFVDAT